MPDRPPRKCLDNRCNVIGNWPRGYCPEHEKAAKRDRNAGRVYGAAWSRTRAAVMSQNPVCQFVNQWGERCKRPGVIGHHIIAFAQRPDLEHDQENIVMLCRECHAHVEANEDTARYTPTCWSFAGIETQSDIGLLPGMTATKEQERLLWSLANRRSRFAVSDGVASLFAGT